MAMGRRRTCRRLPDLATIDHMSGSGGFCTEEYCWFDQAGPDSLDFDAVEEALRKTIPDNSPEPRNCRAADLVEQSFLATSGVVMPSVMPATTCLKESEGECDQSEQPARHKYTRA
jgi:hypothetical protein